MSDEEGGGEKVIVREEAMACFEDCSDVGLQYAVTEDMEGKEAIGEVPIWSGTSTEEWALHAVLPLYAKELLAGGIAGGAAKTAVAPLERIKILFQTKKGNFQKIGVWRSLGVILRDEGFLGFFRGNGASVARVVPYAALHFMTYEQYRRWIVSCYHPSVKISPVVDLLAGSMAGATAVVCTYPLDLIRTRLAYQVITMSTGAAMAVGGTTPVFRGIGDAFICIFREGGLRGLYMGVGPTLWGILPYAGLKFYIYETLKAQLPADEPPSIPLKLTFGAAAGLVGQTVTYPLDVVRRQMQVQPPPSRHRGALQGVALIARTQGWRQLYAGLGINYLKMVPSVAVGFTLYDGLKSWLRVPSRERTRTAAG